MVIPISNILSDLHDLIIWTLKCIVSISYSSECCNCCFCVSFKCLKELSAHKNFADDQYIIGCIIQDLVKNIQEDINFLMIISVVLDELQGPTETEIKNHLTQYQHCDELYLQKKSYMRHWNIQVFNITPKFSIFFPVWRIPTWYSHWSFSHFFKT